MDGNMTDGNSEGTKLPETEVTGYSKGNGV